MKIIYDADQDNRSKIKSIPPTFTKTGNTKKIAGYKCDEYNYIDADDKTTSKVWFSKDANLKIDKQRMEKAGNAFILWFRRIQ